MAHAEGCTRGAVVAFKHGAVRSRAKNADLGGTIQAQRGIGARPMGVSDSRIVIPLCGNPAV